MLSSTVVQAEAGGAGGYEWDKTEGYHEATESVTNGAGVTKVTFKDADNGENPAGF